MTLWDAADPARPSRHGPGLATRDTPSTGLVFSPDGRTLVATSYSGVATLWDVTGFPMIEPSSARAPARRACAATPPVIRRRSRSP